MVKFRLARMIVGPPNSLGEESFDAIVCTSNGWLRRVARPVAPATLDTMWWSISDEFDARAVHAWFDARRSR